MARHKRDHVSTFAKAFIAQMVFGILWCVAVPVAFGLNAAAGGWHPDVGAAVIWGFFAVAVAWGLVWCLLMWLQDEGYLSDD